jgi:signal peptidase I
MNSPRKWIAAVIAVTAGAAAGVMMSLSLGPGWRAYTIEGSSMEPALSHGDLIITTVQPAESIEPGQTAVFVADWASEKTDRRVAHRIAAVGQVGGRVIAYTQGDANLIADPAPIDVTNGARVMSFHIPGGGKLASVFGFPFILAVVSTFSAGLAGMTLSSLLPGAQRRLQLRREAAAPKVS